MTATTMTIPTGATEVDVDYWIVPDPYKPGRHNAVLRDSQTHVWTILRHLQGTGWDIAEVARDRDFPEAAIRAAIEYSERHRDLFDAQLLLMAEEDEH